MRCGGKAHGTVAEAGARTRAVSRRPWAIAIAALATAVARDAAAYRPFDGTDADVADEGEFELEMGPVHYLRQRSTSYLIAPATVLNLGIVRNVELVCDVQNVIGVRRVPGQAQDRLLDTDFLAKWILRRGSLQGDTGLSIAVEGGPLFPELGGEKKLGAQADFIFSYRWSFAAVHFNEEALESRRHEPGVFSSVIVEGPGKWPVRPVGEVYVEREHDERASYSALVGAIWAPRESLAIDLGLRAASTEDVPTREVRVRARRL